MLPKEKRLNLTKNFKWVASGKSISSEIGKIFYRTGDNTMPKVGIALSSSKLKKAVQRNRAKRLISFSFEEAYDKLPASINIVILPNQETLKYSSQELSEKIKMILIKEGIINQ